MGWKTVAVALVLVVWAGVWVCAPVAYIWDGSFHLTVRVSCDPGPPRSVTCQAFGRREGAEEALEHMARPETGLYSAVADPFDGRPLTATVPVSGRDSVCGREVSRAQFQHLVVIAVLPDGRTVGKLVDIPDGRVSREVLVTLP